jgi:hypothetical protein
MWMNDNSLLAASLCPTSAHLINSLQVPFARYFQAGLEFEMAFPIITASEEHLERESIT